MQEPGAYLIDLPSNPPERRRSSNTIANRLLTYILPALMVVLIGASLFWLQWASQRGITLGYPMPKVQITSMPTQSVLVNTLTRFSATAVGRDITYQWNFGDGTVGSGDSVSHTFQSNGTFTVQVTATDAIAQTSTTTASVQVIPPRPTAFFTFALLYGGYVSFDASNSTADPSTSLTTFVWTFGDGNSDSTSSTQEYHQYSYYGTYQVTLVVTDATGQSSDAYMANVVI
ncbi:MAG: hypothetical protein NVSMB33_16600 [Ktedonobacteraceae bacterium]